MRSTNSFLYCKGVFTTVAVSSGQPIGFEKHWNRLRKDATTISLDLSSYNKSGILNALNRSLLENNIQEGRARITLFDGSPSSIWPSAVDSGTGLSVIVAERRILPAEWKLTQSPFSINSKSPLAGIKSCNYLEQIMSLDEAKARGFHEAIRVNERGFVTSACMANVFWVKSGEMFTPSLTTGCLAGTTREFVLENIDCREVEAQIEALDDAEAIFLTSAGIGVVQVAEFEGRQLAEVDHPILHLLPY